jgi:hypothetical protein
MATGGGIVLDVTDGVESEKRLWFIRSLKFVDEPMGVDDERRELWPGYIALVFFPFNKSGCLRTVWFLVLELCSGVAVFDYTAERFHRDEESLGWQGRQLISH